MRRGPFGKDCEMRIRNSFVFNLAIVGLVAALFTIPGAAKQPEAAYTAAQASFGLFLDPHQDAVLSIDLPTGIRSF
jgi:hypothetical protein